MKDSKMIHSRKMFFLLLLTSILFTTTFIGCIEKESESMDLSTIALKSSDVESSMEPFSEEHLTDPYVVEQGKLFEGMLVLEKYEIVFMKTATYFLVQQLATLSDVENATRFLNTLQENDTIPGLISDYVFTNVPSETVADQSVLKTSVSDIDGNETQLFMLVFRKDDTVAILVSGTLEKETILSYGQILEQRLIDFKNNE